MSPDGITAMCMAGLAMGANVPLILAYQLFRLLTINFASPFVIRLIATAKKAPTKLFEIAEESYRVDATDAEGMWLVVSGYLREPGLPCYATPEQCAVPDEKIAFKELCDSAGLPVVKRIDVDEENLSETAAKS